jgi:hypothetical protein
MFSSPLLLLHQANFIALVDVHLRPGKQVSRIIVLIDPTLGECE